MSAPLPFWTADAGLASSGGTKPSPLGLAASAVLAASAGFFVTAPDFAFGTTSPASVFLSLATGLVSGSFS